MANALGQQPIVVNQDMTVGYWETTGATGVGPIFVTKILVTAPSGTVTAGTITVTDAASTPINLLTLPITTALVNPYLLDFTVPLQWRDFKATGLTATGAQLQIWTR